MRPDCVPGDGAAEGDSDTLLEHAAAILWYRAGAVIPWESAAPEVQERYRAKVRMAEYPLYWRVKVIRPEWHGRRCRIVIHGGKGNRLIEFDNGERVVCPGAYLRRAA